MLFAADLLSRQPGAEILFDIKCTRNLYHWIRSHGGKPTIWKTGHSLLKAKMKETGALLAAEMSGHMFFKERWYGFDDGLYTGARLLEILSRVADISDTLNALPDSICTPELHIQTEEGEHHALIAQLKQSSDFPGALNIITLDGIRVEYADGFVRSASGSPPPRPAAGRDRPASHSAICRDRSAAAPASRSAWRPRPNRCPTSACPRRRRSAGRSAQNRRRSARRPSARHRPADGARPGCRCSESAIINGTSCAARPAGTCTT